MLFSRDKPCCRRDMAHDPRCGISVAASLVHDSRGRRNFLRGRMYGRPQIRLAAESEGEPRNGTDRSHRTYKSHWIDRVSFCPAEKRYFFPNSPLRNPVLPCWAGCWGDSSVERLESASASAAMLCCARLFGACTRSG